VGTLQCCAASNRLELKLKVSVLTNVIDPGRMRPVSGTLPIQSWKNMKVGLCFPENESCVITVSIGFVSEC